MKNLALSLLFAIGTLHLALAQTSLSGKTDSTDQFKNYVFAEIGGASFLGISANYERFLSQNPGGLSIRAGIPDIFGDNDKFYAAVPLGISYNISISKNHHNFVELGGTYTFMLGNDYYIDSEYKKNELLMGIIGWRHTNASGKIQIRLTLAPYIHSINDKDTFNIPWFGFSIGRRF